MLKKMNWTKKVKKIKAMKILGKIITMRRIILLTYVRINFVTKETWKNGVKVIVDNNDILWLNEKYIE